MNTLQDDTVPVPSTVEVDFGEMTKARRRELVAWLTHHCGRPDRNKGFWWSDEISHNRYRITFMLDDHRVLFQLTWS
jgi:hypothetical protein